MTAIVDEARAPGAIGQAPPRRILMVVHGYPPDQATGAEVQARRKARWWRERGHRVSVLAADPQPPSIIPFGAVEERADEIDGVEVRRVRYAVPDATRSLQETFAHPLLAAALERELDRARPDLLYQVSGYLFGTVPLRAAARRGIPSVLFAMDYWQTCQRVTLLRPDGSCCPGPRDPADCAACRIAARAPAQRFGTRANRAIRAGIAAVGRAGARTPLGVALGVADFAERRDAIAEALANVSLVVVNSRFLARQMVALGVPPGRALVVRQGIDTREFEGPPAPGAASGGALKALYLGQISWHKGADLAIEAVARLRADGRDIRLGLHGPVTAAPPYLARLRRQIARVPGGGAVSLGAPLDRAGITAALRAADVLVVPSRWYENSPNVILEAFAAGTPVITANHGGMAEMVRDGVDGLLCAPGDAGSLAGALHRLVAEPDLLPRLRAGIRRPSGLDDEMNAEELILDQLLVRVSR